MKSLLKTFLGAIIFLEIIGYTAYAQSIYINNTEQLNIIEQNEIYYMKDTQLFNELGLTYKFDVATQTGVVKFGDNILSLTRDKNVAILNDEEITLNNTPLKGEDSSYNTSLLLPVLEISELVGANVVPYTQREMITVNYEVKDTLSKENIVLNDEINYYTYDEALNLAINNNTQIKDYIEQKNTLQFELDKLLDEYTTTSDSDITTYVKYKMSYMSLQNSLDIYDLTMNSYKNNVEYSLIQLLSNIQLEEEKLLQLEQSIVVNELKYNNYSYKYEKGDISYTELLAIENSYNNSVTDLQYTQTSLSNYKEQLNLLLGSKTGDIVEVEYSFEYQPLTLNIDSYARGNAVNDVSIQNLSSDIEILKYELENYYADGSVYYYEEKDELQSNINSKNRQYTDLVDKKETDIRNKYTELLELQSRYETLQTDYDEALFNYNNTLVDYNIGNKTKLEVEQSYQNLINIKYNILSNSFSQVQAKFLLQNPQLI